MSEPDPHEVRPVSLSRLIGICLGTFLVVFLVLELADPRWIGWGRPRQAAVPALASPQPLALRVPLPTRVRRTSSSPQPAASPGPSETGPAAEGMEAGSPQAVVVDTNGESLRVRATPGPAEEAVGMVEEGSTVELTGGEAEVDGRRWLEVRVPNGPTGWLPADYLASP